MLRNVAAADVVAEVAKAGALVAEAAAEKALAATEAAEKAVAAENAPDVAALEAVTEAMTTAIEAEVAVAAGAATTAMEVAAAAEASQRVVWMAAAKIQLQLPSVLLLAQLGPKLHLRFARCAKTQQQLQSVLLLVRRGAMLHNVAAAIEFSNLSNPAPTAESTKPGIFGISTSQRAHKIKKQGFHDCQRALEVSDIHRKPFGLGFRV